MFKKLLIGGVAVVLVGALVLGAVNRTNARSGSEYAGNGRNGQALAATAGGRGQAEGETRGQGGGRWSVGQAVPAQPATGQANVTEWVTLSGVVLNSAADALVVTLPNGTTVEMATRGWAYAQEQGFTAKPGENVTLVGFYEGADFEVARLTNAVTGQSVAVRDETGRPLWSGRGRGRA